MPSLLTQLPAPLPFHPVLLLSAHHLHSTYIDDLFSYATTLTMSQETPAPVEACVPTQREMQMCAWKHLAAIKAEIYHPFTDQGRVTLEEDHLASLGIRKMSALDVDENAPFDPEPLFFQPYSLDGVDDFPAFVHGLLAFDHTQRGCAWKPECEMEDCSSAEINGGSGIGHHSLDRLYWFLGVLRSYWHCRDTGILEERTSWEYDM